MSESNFDRWTSRGKVWLHLRADEPVGRPLAEWGYRTPRFPQGIKISDLIETTPEIRRETMIVWFLANHEPARGPYFGFAQANSPQIAGFNQAPFFRGGTAADLVKSEFTNIAEEPLLTEVAGLFPGLWTPLLPEPFVDLENLTRTQCAATIVASLDRLAEAVRALAPDHGGIGHNGPPQDDLLVTEDERQIVLRACANARLAVLSSDYATASAAWQAVQPTLQKIAALIGRYVDRYCNRLVDNLADMTAPLIMAYIVHLLRLWHIAQGITTMLEFAKHLLP